MGSLWSSDNRDKVSWLTLSATISEAGSVLPQRYVQGRIFSLDAFVANSKVSLVRRDDFEFDVSRGARSQERVEPSIQHRHGQPHAVAIGRQL